MQKESKAKTPAGEIRKQKIIRIGEGQSLYANFSEVGFSTYDFRIKLSEIQEGTEDEITVKRIANVHLSPQHAKSLLAILGTKIHQYEEEVAKIDVKIEVKDVKDDRF